MRGMGRGACAAYVRREIRRSLLVGPGMLAGGAAFAWMEWTVGVLQDVRMLPLAVPVILFLLAGGVYLLYHGLRVLVQVEASDLCQFIRTELSLEEQSLSGVEMLALVERDLEQAAAFSDGNILIGQEWLFVSNAPNKAVIRLAHLHSTKTRRTQNGRVLLMFMDRKGAGPVTRPLSSAEAGVLQAFLKRNTA